VDLPLPGSPPSSVRPTAEVRRWRSAAGTSLRARRALVGLDQGDLGAHERAERDVVVPQGGRCRGAGVLAVPGEEVRRGLRGAELLQVHGEEGGVVEAVDVAQVVVELQAVQDTGVVEAEDVLGEQIAVTVPHPTLLDPRVEQALAPCQIAAHQPFHLRHPVRHETAIGQRADLLETGPPAG